MAELKNGDILAYETTMEARRIDDLGRLVIPAELRQLLGVTNRGAVVFGVDRKQCALILTAGEAARPCALCEKYPGVRHLGEEVYLCQSCANNIIAKAKIAAQ